MSQGEGLARNPTKPPIARKVFTFMLPSVSDWLDKYGVTLLKVIHRFNLQAPISHSRAKRPSFLTFVLDFDGQSLD